LDRLLTFVITVTVEGNGSQVKLKFHANFAHQMCCFFFFSLMTFEEKDMNQQGHFHKNTTRSHKKSLESMIHIMSNLNNSTFLYSGAQVYTVISL